MDYKKCTLPSAALLVLAAFAASSFPSRAQDAPDTIFAVIGDFGDATMSYEGDVAELIKSWNPDFIVTTGDNNYPDGDASTIDDNIGQYFHEFIYPYTGSYGAGATENLFFPTLGNHDWHALNAQPYLDYFNLPGNERYYDFTRGPIHFLMLDSDTHEPAGYTSASIQATWLREELAASSAPWKLVVFHHAPYSSGVVHGSTDYMQWPFQSWGASAVLSGHEHNYERIVLDGFPYFVNGLGGGNSGYGFIDPPLSGSVICYNDDYGAMRVAADESQISFQFINRVGTVVDSCSLSNATPSPTPTPIDLVVSAPSVSVGERFTADVVINRTIVGPFDGYILIVNPYGKAMCLSGINRITGGSVVPVGRDIPSFLEGYSARVLDILVPEIAGGDYRIIAGLLPAGRAPIVENVLYYDSALVNIR